MIDTMTLPYLNIIEPVSFEANKQKIIDIILTIAPDAVLYESSDEMVQIEAFAYELTYRDNAFNDRLKSKMPTFAKGENLDIACADYYGTVRLEGETDEAFLERSRYSLGQSVTTGALIPYIFHTRSVDARITQVAPYRANDGNITIVWHTLEEDDTELTALQTAINDRLNADELRTLCATSQNVVQATKAFFSVDAHLEISAELDREEVKAAAEANLRMYCDDLRIAEDVALSKISSLLHVNGVKKVTISYLVDDVVTAKNSISVLDLVSLTTSEVQDA